MLAGGREGLGAGRVPDDQIGIGALGHAALARVEVEELGGVGRGHRDELAGREAAAVDAGIPEHRHALLHAAGAVGDLAEVQPAGRLLRGAEGAVVGGGGLQRAGLQVAPQRLLVALGAKRRAHHMGGGKFETRVAVDAVVDHQVAGQHLAVHALAAGAGAGDGLGRLGAGDVHHVDRHVEHIGDGDGALGGLGLHRRRAGERVALGAGDALGLHLLLQQEDQLAVLGVHGGHGAQLQRAAEAVHQGLVVAHDGVLVGHEVLEAVHALLAHQGAHVGVHARPTR
jgi:hypothetical protein